MHAVEHHKRIPRPAAGVLNSQKTKDPRQSSGGEGSQPHPHQVRGEHPPPPPPVLPLLRGPTAGLAPEGLAEEDGHRYEEDEVGEKGGQQWEEEGQQEGEEVVDPAVPYSTVFRDAVEDQSCAAEVERGAHHTDGRWNPPAGQHVRQQTL